MSNLALLRKIWGNWTNVMSCCEILEGRESVLGLRHPETLNSMGNLGSLLLLLDGRQEEGRELINKVIKQLREPPHELPMEHPHIVKFRKALDDAKVAVPSKLASSHEGWRLTRTASHNAIMFR